MESSPPQDYGEKFYWVLNFNLPLESFSQMKGLKFSLISGGQRTKSVKVCLLIASQMQLFP